MQPETKKLPVACCRRAAHRGFTLVEMLVVITIIGILVALGGVAVFKGLEAAKKARIKAEITNLESALQQYKTKYGDFPPSNLDHRDATAYAQMRQHLAKAFPRCNPDYEAQFIPWATGKYPYFDGSVWKLWDPKTNGAGTVGAADFPMSPAQAIVFWLTAFSKDPVHPLSANTIDRQSLFDFDKSRLVKPNPSEPEWDVVTWTSGVPPQFTLINNQTPVPNPGYYVPQSGKGMGYVYFEARSYFVHCTKSPSSSTVPPVVPYLSSEFDKSVDGHVSPGTNKTTSDVVIDAGNNVVVTGKSVPPTFQEICVNPKSFQIISAGLDGDYGNSSPTITDSVRYNGINGWIVYPKWYPGGSGYDTADHADDDNITNFSEKPLGDAKPE